MAAFENDSRPMSRVMVLGIVAMVAALGFLGWRMLDQRSQAAPVSHEAAPAPEPAQEPQPQQQQAVPLSGDRAAG